MPGRKKRKSNKQIEVILENKNSDKELAKNGIYLQEEDVKIIYNAIAAYKLTEEEEHLHSLLLEEFEEILVVDYNESPDVY